MKYKHKDKEDISGVFSSGVRLYQQDDFSETIRNVLRRNWNYQSHITFERHHATTRF